GANVTCQCRPPSPVTRMRASPFSASPALAITPAPSLCAWTERKSREVKPGTVSTNHVRPPSIDRATVPRAPLAHTTRSLTTLSPRSSASVPLRVYVHCASAAVGRASTASTVSLCTGEGKGVSFGALRYSPAHDHERRYRRRARAYPP